MPFQTDEFCDDRSSKTTLHDFQDAGLAETQLLRSETPIFTKDLSFRKSPKWMSRWRRFSSVLQAAFFLSAIVCMWIVAFTCLQAARVSKQIHTHSHNEAAVSASLGIGEGGYTLAEDIAGQVPRFDTEPWMFWNDSKFQIDDPRTATHEDEMSLRKAWKSIVPEGDGFILVDNPKSSVLPPPINRPAGSDMDRFCLTVFHQLHCLRGMQEAFYEFIKDPSTEPQLAHFNHCLDYLREGVMCYGDTALEGQSTYSSGERANGNGSLHVCKSFERILDWANTRSSRRLSRLHNGHIPKA